MDRAPWLGGPLPQPAFCAFAYLVPRRWARSPRHPNAARTTGPASSPSAGCRATACQGAVLVARTRSARCKVLGQRIPLSRCSVLNGYDAADRSSIGAPFSFDASWPIAGARSSATLPEAFDDEGANDADRAAL